MSSGAKFAFAAAAASAITIAGFVLLDPMRDCTQESVQLARSRVEVLEREVRDLRAALAGRRAAPGEGPTLAQPLGSRPSPALEEISSDPPFLRTMQVIEETARRQSERATAWREKIVQVADAPVRQQGLREVADALRDSDPATVEAALRVFEGMHLAEANYDRAEMRALVLPHLESDQPRISWRAAEALQRIRRDPEDPSRILARAERDRDPDLRLLHYLFTGDGAKQAEGRVADFFVRLLSTDDPRRAFEAAAALSDVSVNLSLHDAVVAAFRRHGTAEVRNAWLLALARVVPRREPGVEAVFELLSVPDPENQRHGYVLDALASNVANEAMSLAARRAADLLVQAPTSSIRQAALRALYANGTRDQSTAVRSLAENPLMPQSERDQALRVLRRIEDR